MKYAEPEKFASLLFAFAAYLHREMKARIDVPLNATQVHALFFIRCRVRPLMREIAHDLSIRPPSATTLVEDLQRRGFVRRVADAKDKRSVRIALTPRGQALIRNRLKLLVESIKEITQSLSIQEKRQFVQSLDRILSIVDQKHV
jgi:DNA-binding MarR family transcriptional regulator